MICGLSSFDSSEERGVTRSAGAVGQRQGGKVGSTSRLLIIGERQPKRESHVLRPSVLARFLVFLLLPPLLCAAALMLLLL